MLSNDLPFPFSSLGSGKGFRLRRSEAKDKSGGLKEGKKEDEEKLLFTLTRRQEVLLRSKWMRECLNPRPRSVHEEMRRDDPENRKAK